MTETRFVMLGGAFIVSLVAVTLIFAYGWSALVFFGVGLFGMFMVCLGLEEIFGARVEHRNQTPKEN